jgi:fimbrial chaperone protein
MQRAARRAARLAVVWPAVAVGCAARDQLRVLMRDSVRDSAREARCCAVRVARAAAARVSMSMGVSVAASAAPRVVRSLAGSRAAAGIAFCTALRAALRTASFALCAAALCIAGSGIADSAFAATLQISPVTVEIAPDVNAVGITLANPGDTPLYGQVRVFRWDQQKGDDALTPTQDVVASPPLIQVAGHAEQLVRLVRTAPRTAGEQCYRLLIDELPPPDQPAANGVTIRLRYSVPVFVEPANVVAAPRLTWRIAKSGNDWLLRVDNAGAKRAQIAAVQLVTSSGKVYELNKGLLGYALAGRGRQWQIPLPGDADLSGSVKVRASVNALPAEALVTIDQGG